MVTPVKKSSTRPRETHSPFLELCLGRLLCYKGLIFLSSKPVPVRGLRTVILNILIGKRTATGNKIKDKELEIGHYKCFTSLKKNYLKNVSFKHVKSGAKVIFLK